jgi:carbamoyl-phosphate synthase large subunit
MKRILVTGAGGAPTTNFVRSLRDAPEPFYLIGIDVDKYNLERAEVNESHLVPRVSEPAYLPVLCDIIKESGAEFIFSQPDQEVDFLSRHRDEVPIRMFLPHRDTVAVCLDKYSSFERWEQAGIKVPGTLLVESPADLGSAFERFGSPVWLRTTVGAAGRGALCAKDATEAEIWLNFHKGWGKYTAAEYLSPQSVTWQSIWKEGELVVAQGRLRLYWEFADRAASGITGVTGTGVTVSDPEVDRIALAAIKAVDSRPNGVFSVDLTYDGAGVPNTPEINIGRFFTTHYFFTSAGVNFPYIVVKLAFDEPLPHISQRINPLTPGLAWVRGMDVRPTLTTIRQIDLRERELDERKARLMGARSA